MGLLSIVAVTLILSLATYLSTHYNTSVADVPHTNSLVAHVHALNAL